MLKYLSSMLRVILFVDDDMIDMEEFKDAPFDFGGKNDIL